MNFITELPPEAFVRMRDVSPVVGLKPPTIYQKVREGRFPAPVKVTAYAARWRVSDIRTWLSDPAGWRAEREAA